MTTVIVKHSFQNVLTILYFKSVPLTSNALADMPIIILLTTTNEEQAS